MQSSARKKQQDRSAFYKLLTCGKVMHCKVLTSTSGGQFNCTIEFSSTGAQFNWIWKALMNILLSFAVPWDTLVKLNRNINMIFKRAIELTPCAPSLE